MGGVDKGQAALDVLARFFMRGQTGDAIDFSWLILLEQVNRDSIPRGRDDWQEPIQFLDSAQEGDEFWCFECSSAIDHPLSGCSGIALKRRGRIVGHLITRRILT